MPKTAITLIKGDRISSETDYRDQLPVNMYAVKKDILGAQGYMISNDGLRFFRDVVGIDRGGVYNERLRDQYRLSGESFVKINQLGAFTVLGEILGTKQVSMPYSFNTQAIIGNNNFYLYDPVSGFRKVTDPDVGNPIDCVWINGYYFLTDGEFLYHTDITNEEAIDPLKFATAEFNPDPTLGLSKTQDNKVVVWGRYSIEYFTDIAAQNFAFTRIESRAQKIGIVATHAKVETGNKFYIVGGGKDKNISVYMVSIGSSIKISTREIDKILQKYTDDDLSDIRLETRMESDTIFIIIHLPEETLCFNETIYTQFGKDVAWSILKSNYSGNPIYRAINGVYDGRINEWVYGDKFEAKISILDKDLATHYNEIVETILYSPFINLEKSSIDEIEIDTIPGFNIDPDATIGFSVTYDGIAYSDEWWNLYSETGEYNLRFILRRLGYVDHWIGFKFRGVTRSKLAFALMTLEYN